MQIIIELNRLWYKKIKLIQIISFLAIITMLSCTTEKNARIQPWPQNPYYWQYKEEPLLLIGGSDDDNLFQWEKSALTKQLDLLESVGGNYIRNTMSSRDPGNIEPFLQLDNGLYDLDQWNPVYWDRFENLLELAYERDIIIQIEIWDPHDWYFYIDENGDDWGWTNRAFNPANNINFTYEESHLIPVIDWKTNASPELTMANPFFHTVYDEKDMDVVLHYQERFVEKVLEESVSYPNVLYCITNESGMDINWSLYWLDFVKNTASRLKKRVYVTEMLLYPTSELVAGHGFDFADISQTASGMRRPAGSNTGQGHFESVAAEVDRLSGNPVPVNSVKQYGGEIDWTRGPDEGVERIWRTIFGGQAGARFHRPPAGMGLNERVQANIKSLRMITDNFDLQKVQSHQKLGHLFLRREANDAYLMAEEGKVYAVFFPGTGGEVELDISALNGEVMVRRLNPNNAEWHDEKSFKGNSIVLTKPGESQWVVQITTR